MKKVAAAVLLMCGLLGHHPALADPEFGTDGYYLFTGAMYYGLDSDGMSGWYCEYIGEVDGKRHWMFFADGHEPTSEA